MTKKDLVKGLVEKMEGTTQKQADEFLKALAEVVGEALTKGEEVTIPDLFKTGTKFKEARVGRNPATGESMDIPAKTVVTVKPVKALKDKVK